MTSALVFPSSTSAVRRGQNTSVVATAGHCSGRATYFTNLLATLRQMAVGGLRQRTNAGFQTFTCVEGRCTHSQTRRVPVAPRQLARAPRLLARSSAGPFYPRGEHD